MFEITFGRITRHGRKIMPVSRISEHTFTKSFQSLADIAKFWSGSPLQIVRHNLNKHQFQMLTRKLWALESRRCSYVH